MSLLLRSQRLSELAAQAFLSTSSCVRVLCNQAPAEGVMKRQ